MENRFIVESDVNVNVESERSFPSRSPSAHSAHHAATGHAGPLHVGALQLRGLGPRLHRSLRPAQLPPQPAVPGLRLGHGGDVLAVDALLLLLLPGPLQCTGWVLRQA